MAILTTPFISVAAIRRANDQLMLTSLAQGDLLKRFSITSAQIEQGGRVAMAKLYQKSPSPLLAKE